MRKSSDSERGFIGGAQMAAASVTKMLSYFNSNTTEIVVDSIFDEHDVPALPQETENVKTEGYYSVSVHKPLITEMNAHLRVQWCKNQRQLEPEGSCVRTRAAGMSCITLLTPSDLQSKKIEEIPHTVFFVFRVVF
uniref:Uncharacterized protein n=1 Tax=Seriola dumerili TaxID=41447 RepID=A0A3B4VHL7_SERDU